jgi:(2Fe-2S) ferredoxin
LGEVFPDSAWISRSFVMRSELTAPEVLVTLAAMGQRQHYLFVCTNRRADDNPKGSCAAKGSEAVHQALKAELFQRGLAKVEARVCTASCLDQCATGVSILVEPDHFFYGRVTVEDVPAIVEALQSGRRVDRLVLDAEDLKKG